MIPKKELVSLEQLRNVSPDKFNQTINDIHIWIGDNLEHGVDYEWSIALFTYTDNNGMNEYPYGIFFYDEADRSAFKLKFNL